MIELGVNIDHVATLREARKTYEPDPVLAASLAELGGADSITIHLREDHRHIQPRDVRILSKTVAVPINFEMACEEAALALACEILPRQVTFVPEKREEVTTEGGLDIMTHRKRLAVSIKRLQEVGIEVSLFIDPVEAQIMASAELGVTAVELHTGAYANVSGAEQTRELQELKEASAIVHSTGLRLHAGHGLTYRNVLPVAKIAAMHELNIGHSIIARAVMVGLTQAVRDMRNLLDKAERRS